MRKPFLFLFVFTFFSSFLFAQESFQRNSFYIEAFGSGLFGSLNYERQLTKKPGIGVRIGAGFYAEKASSLTIPLGINYLFPLSAKNRFIDAGFTVSPTYRDGNFRSKGNDKWTNFVPSVGYRSHTKKDWMWRISITPVINRFAFTPSAGFSIGKVF